MRDAIQNLAKASVTALIKSDSSALAIEGGKLAIDQKGKLETLIARVEGELEHFADVELKGRADLEPAIGNATILFEKFGLTATELVDLSLQPARATDELLRRGKPVLDAAGEGVGGLCSGRIAPRVYELLLDDPQTIAELSPAITRALLSQREAIEKIPDEVGASLRHMLGHHLVIDPTEIWRPELSDIYLLRAEYGVVPFHEQRQPEVDRLLAWCGEDARIAVRVITGAGGTGKTRLMIELCRQARLRRWRAGFLDRETPAKPSWELDGLVDGEEPLLLVVDYAETKRDVLVPVLRRLSLGHGAPKTRVILIARAISDWLPDLRRADPKLQELLDETKVEVEELPAIAPPVEQRSQIVEAAAIAFADRLPATEIREGRPSAAAMDLSAPHFANALFLHVAALAAVVGDPAAEEDALLRFVLVREERHWQAGLASDDLTQALDVNGVAQVHALATLVGGAKNEQAGWRLLKKAPLLADCNLNTRKKVSSMLHRLYPGDAYLEPLRPDIIGEYLIAVELKRQDIGDADGLIDQLVPSINFEERMHLIAVLTRITRSHEMAPQWLQRAIEISRIVESPARILNNLEAEPSKWSLRDDDIDMLRPLLSAA